MAKSTINRKRFLLLASAAALSCVGAQASAESSIAVLFICQHGYAKSLVAALHFERMASERGVQAQALSRGVDPGAQVLAAIVAGLAADGFFVADFVPSRATPAELDRSDYVVLMSVDFDVPERSRPTMRWDDVSALSDNYSRARDEILAHAASLLDRIESNGGAQR